MQSCSLNQHHTNPTYMMASDLILLVIFLLASQDLCVKAQNKDGCRYVAYHVHTLNQVKLFIIL